MLILQPLRADRLRILVVAIALVGAAVLLTRKPPEASAVEKYIAESKRIHLESLTNPFTEAQLSNYIARIETQRVAHLPMDVQAAHRENVAAQKEYLRAWLAKEDWRAVVAKRDAAEAEWHRVVGKHATKPH